MGRIWHVLPKHRHMEDVVHMRETRWGRQLIGHRSDAITPRATAEAFEYANTPSRRMPRNAARTHEVSNNLLNKQVLGVHD